MGASIFNFSFETFIYLIEAVILIACFGYTKKSKKPYAKEVGILCISVSAVLFEKALLTCVLNYALYLGIYTVYEITHLWAFYATMRFALAFIHRQLPENIRKIFISLAASDGILFAVNIIWGRMFELSISPSGTVTINTHPIYIVHEAILAIYILYICYNLILKLRSTNIVFWLQYVILIAGIVVADVWDLISLSTSAAAFHQRHVFFGGVVLVFLMTQIIRSRILRSYEFSAMLDSMSQFLFLFDGDGDCVLANSEAIEYFELDEFDLSGVFDIVHEMTMGEENAYEDEFEKLCKYNKDGQVHYLRLNYKRIQNRKSFVGEVYGFTDVTKETMELEEQKRLARYDGFTHVYNSDWLFKCIQDEITENPDTEYYVIGSDIRDFKVFNDVFDKDAGDAIILKTAEVLKDLYEEGLILHFGRIYADRFGFLAQKDGFLEDRIVKEFLSIDHPFKEDYYHLNIHFGIYRTSLEPGIPVKSMFDRAYVALDTIKNDVNIRTFHYNEVMRDEKVWEQTISGNIEKALNDGQIRIVVQPQVNSNEEIIGGEALVRWRHPENGEISPGNFIPILEKTGLVTGTDIFVWEESCKLLRRWKDLGYTDYYISVNISATDFVFTDIYTIFSGLVEKYDIDPKNLKLEITETSMMTDVLERIVLIKRLRERGFTVELDDFGSGYSSLNMLKEIPVDVIKLDMKFLYSYNNEPEANSRKIIGHMISMAKDLDMKIVAEGVETEDQLNFLRDIGCDVFQGYFFSKPIEVEEFERNQGIA